jgi:hypothetical protein
MDHNWTTQMSAACLIIEKVDLTIIIDVTKQFFHLSGNFSVSFEYLMYLSYVLLVCTGKRGKAHN